MAYDLNEQEQMENLKAFWARWGKWVSGVVVVGALAFLGWKAYGYYLMKQSEQASQVYEAYANALQKKDASADALLVQLQKDEPKSRYTALASLNAAQVSIAQQQWDKAQIPLRWLMSNGTPENQGVAQLQLADVLAQTNQTDEAVKVLDTLPLPEFAAAFANKKADVYLLANNPSKAREALSLALKTVQAQASKDAQLEQAIQAKLDMLPN